MTSHYQILDKHTFIAIKQLTLDKCQNLCNVTLWFFSDKCQVLWLRYKYCASPMVSIVPVIVTLRSGAPSSALDILIIAPDTCLKKITKLHYTNSDTYLKLIVLSLWKYVYQGFGRHDFCWRGLKCFLKQCSISCVGRHFFSVWTSFFRIPQTYYHVFFFFENFWFCSFLVGQVVGCLLLEVKL
jgi:hypothetical protein